MSDGKMKNTVDAVLQHKYKWGWLAWAVPIAAITMAGWMVYSAVPKTSASIVLVVDNADNIEANQTRVFFRGVRIGGVTGIDISEDKSSVSLQIELDEGYEDFARESARYWVVRPNINTGSLQSLTTIVSGPEIHADPGTGSVREVFTAVMPPLAGTSPNDLKIYLTSPVHQDITRGTQLSYRGFKTGVVTGSRLDSDASQLIITINVFEKYSHLVRKNSVFWNSGGLDIDFSIFSGADISSSSISSLLGGEISLATPEGMDERAENGHTFSLTDELDEDWMEWQPAFEEVIGFEEIIDQSNSSARQENSELEVQAMPVETQ